MLKNYLEFLDSVEKSVPLKKRILYKIVSLLLGIFFILPIILIDVNLLYLYYDLEIILVLILHLSFVVLIMLYSKFIVDCYKGYEIEMYDKRKSYYLFNLIWSAAIALIIFIIYLISRS